MTKSEPTPSSRPEWWDATDAKAYPSFRDAIYECVTKPGGPLREQPHGADGVRHRDGCRMIAPCGCERRYYSSFYNPPSKSGWRIHSPSGRLDGFCVEHHRAFLKRAAEAQRR